MKSSHFEKIRKSIVYLGEENSIETPIDLTQVGQLDLVLVRLNVVTEQQKMNQIANDLLNASPDAIVGVNEKHEIIFINQTTTAIFGYTKEELLGLSFDKLIPYWYSRIDKKNTPSDVDNPVVEHVAGLMRIMFGIRKNLQEFPIDVTLSYAETPNGKIALASIRDITEELEIRDVLEESKNSFESLIELSQDAIFILGEEHITQVNQAFLKLFGYNNKEEIIGKLGMEALIHPDDFHFIQKSRDVLHKKGTFFAPFLKTLKKDGSSIICESRYSPILLGGKLHVQIISRDITKQKETEKELYESRKLLNESENLAYLGSWVWDIESNIIELSVEARRIYGIEKHSEILNYEDWLKIVHPEDLERVKDKIVRLSKIGGQLDFEYRVIRPNGEERELECWNTIETDKNGAPLKMVGAILDITERKEITENLKNSIAEFKDFFESSADEMCLIEPISKKIIKVNETFCEATGYTKKELEGKKITIFFPQAELIKCAKKLEHVLNGRTEVFLTKQLKKDGTTYPVEIKVKMIKFKGKNTILAILRDVTERIQTSKKIARFSQIFEDSLNEIFLFDTKSLKFIQVNKAAQKNLGYSMEELYNLTVIDIKPGYSIKAFKKLIKPLLKGEKNKLVFETVYQRKDKSLYHAEVHLQIIENPTESLFTAIVLDITQRKEIEKKNLIISVISNKLSKNLSSVDFSKYVFGEIQKIKPFPNINVSIYDEAKDEVKLIFHAENGELQTKPLKPRIHANGLCEYIIESKEGLLLNGNELQVFRKKKNLTKYGRRAESWVGVPLMFENKVLGVLSSQSFLPNYIYTNDDLDLLSFIGSQIASLIEKECAEKEIRQFEKYFSVSMELLCIAGIDGFFKKINPKFSELLGFSEKELLSIPFIEFVHPEDAELTLKEVKSLSKGIPTINFINRFRCKNNEYKWLKWTSIFEPENNSLYSSARDITKEKKSEEILTSITNIQDSFISATSKEETFEKILNVLLSVTHSEYGFIEEVVYKGDGTAYFNTSAFTSINQNIKTFDSDKENARRELGIENLKVLFKQVINIGKTVITNNLNHDASVVEILPEPYPLYNFMSIPFFKKDELVGIVCLANKPSGYGQSDIDLIAPFLATCSTLLKAHQNNKKREKAESDVRKMADIVSHSSDAIISTNKDGTILSWNSGAERILGYSRKEIIGTSIDHLKPEALRIAYKTVISEARNGKPIERYETLKLKKGYTVRYVNMSIFPLIDENGNVKGVSSILRDITEQKTAQQAKEEFTKILEIEVGERTQDLQKVQVRLERSLEKEKELGDLKSRFVATASHQFRTPLAVIQASIGILDMQKDLLDKQFQPKFDKVYNRIIGQISRMTNLMDEVLILGKINDGKIKPTFKQVDLISLCNGISKNYNEIQQDNRIMQIEVTGNINTVLLDEKLFEQALSNLISNAFKYSVGRQSPIMTISFMTKVVCISIKDYGVGIPDTDLPLLFEPFYRASNVHEISGTGLGSSIAKEYIELNGGTIRVNSDLKEGSEFIITLKN
ncbi:MAG: PAS domain S-box-containing protein [Crocinitomix sp.]|jgi:PAS domain S-box-containing protein